MDPTQIQEGAGGPDTSASAGEGTQTDITGAQTPPEVKVESPDQQISVPEVKVEETKEADITAEFEELTKEQPTDTDLVKKLRGLAKTKFEDFSSKIQPPEPSEETKESLELVEELFKFDVTKGEPTTRGFVEKLAAKDVSIASQLLFDLTQVGMNKPGTQGWTLGHELLSRVGLDPYKLPELQAFSRGEITGAEIGLEQIPDYIPGEYRDAYKNLPQVTRTDLDTYLGPNATPDQKAAALSVLSDKARAMNVEASEAQRTAIENERINNEIYTETETQVTGVYEGLLQTIQTSDIFKNIKVSSNDMVDQSVKSSLLAQITALGDPRSVLASQAVKNFENMGVKVDTAKINSLMAEVEQHTTVAVQADKLGKLRGVDYSKQIQDALGKRASSVSKLLALANSYVSQSLSKFTGVTGTTTVTEGGPPNFEGGTLPTNQGSGKFKTQQEFDAHVEAIAEGIRKQNSASG